MSDLWWQLVSNGVTPNNAQFPMDKPVWRLMRDQLPVLSASIAALNSSSWSSDGGFPFVMLVEHTDPFPPPFAGGVFRIFTDDSSSFQDIPVDGFTGYSTLSLQCIDSANSWFAPTESLGISLTGANYGIMPSTFSLQISASDAPAGPFFVAITQTGSLTVAFTTIQFNYGTTTGSISRIGIVVNAQSGSPQLSLEPVNVDPTVKFPGDIWFRGGNGAGDPNFMFADADTTGSTYIARIMASRDGESSGSLIARFGTSDAPSSSILGVNTIVTDNWLITVNSALMTGGGWQNVTWGGGIYMPDSGTVAVWSRAGQSHNFLIPSGTLIVKNSFIIQSGSFTVLSGSMTLNSGSLVLTSGNLVVQDTSGTIFLSGSKTQLSLSGSGAQILLRGTPVIAIMTGSLNSSSLTSPSDGTLYINTGTLPNQISLRTNSQWVDFALTSPLLIDDGFF
jgi:hypothetical protein